MPQNKILRYVHGNNIELVRVNGINLNRVSTALLILINDHANIIIINDHANLDLLFGTETSC